MPIGTIATVGAAVIGAGAGIYSSSKAAKAQKDAAKDAAATQNAGLAEAASIQAQTAKDNNVFAEHMYDRNEGWLSPTIMGGWAAGDEILGLLLGEAPAKTPTGGTTGAPASTPMQPNGWYPSAPPPKVTSQPGTGTGTGAPPPTSQQSLDDWATGALNAMLPNITRSANIAAINAATTPMDKLNVALALSPPSSDQYPAYQAYVAANPKPTPAPAAPTTGTPPPTTPPTATPTVVVPGGPHTVRNAVVSQQPVPTNAVAAVAPAPAVAPQPNAVAAVAPPAPAVTSGKPIPLKDRGPIPKLGDFKTADGKPDSAAFRAAMDAWRMGPTAAAPAATTATADPAATPATPAPNNAVAAASAFDTFKNSTEYKNRLDGYLDGVATKYAAAGAFESGAEKQAIGKAASVFASNELALYMDNLYRQQALGASAASSLAGVGTQLTGQVTANNQNAANAQAGAAVGAAGNTGNAILQAGQSSANQWNNVGSAIGTAAGGIAGAFQPAPNNAVAAIPPQIIPPGYGGIYQTY